MSKCRYKYCKHGGVVNDDDDFVKKGTAYYHKECFEEKNKIDEIIHVFSEEVNRDVVFAQLRKVINNLVVNKNTNPDFILFGIRYYLDNHIPLNYPAGLYYVITNKDVNKAWKKKYEEKYKPKPVEINDVKHVFNYNPPKQRTIGEMFE